MNGKPRDGRWTALSIATLAVFAAMFALCAFAGPCGGRVTTLSGAAIGSDSYCADGACSMGASAAAAIEDLDLNAAIANGTATIGSAPMKCHWSYGAAAGMALFGVLAALGMLRLPGVHGRRFAGILAALAALAASAYPLVVFGTCADPMSCARMTWPLLALSAIGVLCGILAWFWCKPPKPRRGL